MASPTANISGEVLDNFKEGVVIVSNVDGYYNRINNGEKQMLTEPVFKSYREYMTYLQTKNKLIYK